jgi:hypothetical protein
MKGEHLTAVGKLSGVLGVALASGAILFGGDVDHGPAPLCRRAPLHAVYKPERFKVLAVCRTIHATIVAARKEHDGDYHVSVVVDEPGWTNDLNNKRQHGSPWSSSSP